MDGCNGDDDVLPLRDARKLFPVFDSIYKEECTPHPLACPRGREQWRTRVCCRSRQTLFRAALGEFVTTWHLADLFHSRPMIRRTLCMTDAAIVAGLHDGQVGPSPVNGLVLNSLSPLLFSSSSSSQPRPDIDPTTASTAMSTHPAYESDEDGAYSDPSYSHAPPRRRPRPRSLSPSSYDDHEEEGYSRRERPRPSRTYSSRSSQGQSPRSTPGNSDSFGKISIAVALLLAGALQFWSHKKAAKDEHDYRRRKKLRFEKAKAERRREEERRERQREDEDEKEDGREAGYKPLRRIGNAPANMERSRSKAKVSRKLEQAPDDVGVADDHSDADVQRQGRDRRAARS